MTRKILSVFIGYIIFAMSAAFWFIATSHDPHGDASLKFKLATAAYGIFFSILAGLVLQLIAKSKNLPLNFILGIVMFVLAATSMILSEGNHWTQLFAMFIFAPVSVLGGYLKNKLLG